MISLLIFFKEYISIFPLGVWNVVFFCLFFSYLDTVQIRSILYSSQPIKLEIFFRISDNLW